MNAAQMTIIKKQLNQFLNKRIFFDKCSFCQIIENKL